ncbi:hypothetical protein PH210_15215 [Paenibacillus sp. BSR1-1]|uniref:hypothetical protein n=1 Tax=Paenibacillus sp. BSR1-1 TaxID=3020845 RepID=UPI0025AF1D62|nr:hypothetical protein [Paenibacillus sp. BSR1-1]MDN3017547.1 hypothetical protein [Paenibacillus sp. BSR1-1]
MKHNKMLLLVLMILPWLSVPFLGKRTIKRFFPGALFMGAWVTVESILARKRVWWRFTDKLLPGVMGEIPFIVGPFFVGTLWIFKLTFGNFFRYLIVNLIIDVPFTFLGMHFLRKLGIVSLVRLKHYQMSLLFMAKSVLMYIFQGSIEKVRKKPKSLLQRIFS